MNACGCCVPDTATDDLVPDCGDAPAPMNASIPNVLLIGDSISMGTAATEGKPPYNPLGYGWGVRDALAVADIAQVQHNGGWFIAGQAGPSSKGVQCIGHWLGSGKWDVVHLNHGLHDIDKVCHCPRMHLAHYHRPFKDHSGIYTVLVSL